MHSTLGLLEELRARQASIAVIGMGYVGLPLALCLARHFIVVGFDVDEGKIAALLAGHDPVGDSGDAAVAEHLHNGSFSPTSDATRLNSCRFVVVAVPTPVDAAKRPDFTPLVNASATLGRYLAPGTIVVYESTVYPGATEEICIPVVERASGKSAGIDFFYGYSPERINPGDREHTVDRIRKVVSGSDDATKAVIAGVYGTAIAAGVYMATSVKVAEASKVIENTQRDLNIALMNEFALIFHRLGIDTGDVLAAAGTKWNFLPFTPGLVGGHCIGVDPYYLIHKAELGGYQPRIIPAGRRINEGMGSWIAQECVRLMAVQGATIKDARVLILGLAFKEDCADVRNTKVLDISNELRRFGCRVLIADPVVSAAAAKEEFDIDLISFDPLPRCEAVIAAVAHSQFKSITRDQLARACPEGPVLDVKGVMDRNGVANLWRL